MNDASNFAILDNSTGEAAGHPGLRPRIEPTHRVIEVEAHYVYPFMQRTIVLPTEAQYLSASYVCDALRLSPLAEWRCDDLNAAWKRAAARFGFTFEGVFRQHMIIIKGRNRDTAPPGSQSLDAEWPARCAAFERWLDPANFDAGRDARRCVAHEPECGMLRRHVGNQCDRRSGPDLSATREIPFRGGHRRDPRCVRFTPAHSSRPLRANSGHCPRA